MVDVRKKFGKKIRELRTERKLSQEALANKADLDRTYIPSIEKGERNVSLQVIQKLSIALDIRMVDLFKGLDT